MEKLRKFPKIPENIPQRCFYAFGPFRLDRTKRLLMREGEPIPLGSKDFDLLLALVEQRGEVLVKEELLQSVWPDAVVEEGNLNRHVATLRKALGDSPDEHGYIVTVPGRGYRFVAEVRELRGDPGHQVGHAVDRVAAGEEAEDWVRAPFVAVSVPSFGVSRSAAPSHPLGIRIGSTWLMVGVVVTVAVIVLAIAGARWLPLRAKPILTNTDYVLICDFANTTGDPVFDDTMKQAISVQLGESPFLNILSDASVRASLKLMTKPPDTRLVPDVARDLCQRAGAKVYIAGTIASIGSQYVIGLNAVSCQAGDTLAQQQVTAKSKEHVLKALDEAAAKIRSRLGESLSTLQNYDTPLEQATTSSLEALKAFTQGNLARDRKGDAATIPFFKRAIELDPQFALAYDALGLTYSNLDEPGLASESISKAYALRERASEREKFDIDANYSQIGTGELEKANQVAELWAQAYPRDPYPHNLLGVNFEFLGQYDKAVVEILEAVRLHPEGVVLHSDLMEDYTALNRLDLAKATYKTALDRKLDHAYLHADRYGIAFLENDQAEMGRQLAWAVGRPGGEDLLLSLESDTRAFFGNLEKAREYSWRAFASSQHANQKETAALWQMNSALREAEFGNFERARRDTAAALAVATTRDVQILAALVLARAGDSQRSQEIADDLAKRFPRNTVVKYYWLPSIRAAIELNQRNPSRALEILGAVSPYDFAYPNPQAEVGRYLYPVYLRGQAYLLMSQGSAAAVEFQKFLDHRTVVINCPLAALARLGLARAYALQADPSKARIAYQDFFALWKDASLSTPVFKQASAEYARLQ